MSDTPYGLPVTAVEQIQRVFAAHPEVAKAVLYGSRAKGNYKHGSDIDLTLFGEGMDHTLLARIANELDDLLLPYTIDLSIHAQLDHAALREHIERVGREFYVRTCPEK